MSSCAQPPLSVHQLSDNTYPYLFILYLLSLSFSGQKFSHKNIYTRFYDYGFFLRFKIIFFLSIVTFFIARYLSFVCSEYSPLQRIHFPIFLNENFWQKFEILPIFCRTRSLANSASAFPGSLQSSEEILNSWV